MKIINNERMILKVVGSGGSNRGWDFRHGEDCFAAKLSPSATVNLPPTVEFLNDCDAVDVEMQTTTEYDDFCEVVACDRLITKLNFRS